MKFLFALAAALGIAAVSYAAAADVSVNGGALQQGSDETLKCTENVTVDFQNYEGLGLADVVITGFDEDCIGAYFYLEFLDEYGVVLESCPDDAGAEPGPPPGGIEITATEMTFDDNDGDYPCSGAPSIPDTYEVRVTIVGGGETPY